MITTSTLDKAIFTITGLIPTLKDSESGLEFTLGTNQPILIGFEKVVHPEISDDSFRYSCRVKMLEVIANYLKTPDAFENWIQMQNLN